MTAARARAPRPNIGPAPAQPGKFESAGDPNRALRRLLPYLRPYALILAVVLVLVLITTGLGLLGPYLLGRAIDVDIASADAAGLLSTALQMLGVYVGYNILQAISSWVMARISQRALRDLRQDLFAHLQALSIGFFDAQPAGELMSRLTNDIDAINQAVSQNVIALVASVLTMVGILVTMFVLDPWLALATVLVVPIMFWFADFVARYTRRGFRVLQKELGGLNAVMEETLSGQKVVKAFQRSDAAISEFRAHNQTVYSAAVSANTYALMLMPLTNVLGNFFVIVLASLGGWLALQDLVTVGLIATFIAYGQAFIQPLRQLATLYNSIQAALAGAERVFEIIDTAPETHDPADAAPLADVRGHVEFQDVSFGYHADRPVLAHMTLEAQPGQVVALVGPTGAGKTTVINLLTRFYEIQGGRILLDGRDLREIRKADLRRHLGIVLQDTFMFADTVLENIRYGRLEATDAEVMRAAELADADHFIHQLPHGYHTVLTERAGNLSQGQRQLLAIARAILADPAILILDEATSSVDTRTEARIQRSLLRLMEGRTSFVIAHRLSTIRDADNVVVIDHGRIIEHGTHDALMAKRGFYYQLHLSQYKGLEI